jgi:hypothetical protein
MTSAPSDIQSIIPAIKSVSNTGSGIVRAQSQESACWTGVDIVISELISPTKPTRGGPPAWGFGVGLTTPHRKKQSCYQNSHEASDMD